VFGGGEGDAAKKGGEGLLLNYQVLLMTKIFHTFTRLGVKQAVCLPCIGSTMT
jgi:hypothetical protein